MYAGALLGRLLVLVSNQFCVPLCLRSGATAEANGGMVISAKRSYRPSGVRIMHCVPDAWTSNAVILGLAGRVFAINRRSIGSSHVCDISCGLAAIAVDEEAAVTVVRNGRHRGEGLWDSRCCWRWAGGSWTSRLASAGRPGGLLE
ncbi:hypothetical protein K402DRAFT_142137 [Aulographum hederae CBS 113979]|uniref:Secreted protein n=1 Tax=Aulographum hederae CBS 113979 TaxID=1176131 RepID=A0A6G1GTR2_9PEZI|nr:hypothetical protein K402DRAFT_142137 [Aulographum hederae CBS 113979]